MDVTKRIAEYLVTTSLEDFPPEAVEAAKGAIVDCLGCTLAGSREPLADVLTEYVKSIGGHPAASVVVTTYSAIRFVNESSALART